MNERDAMESIGMVAAGLDTTEIDALPTRAPIAAPPIDIDDMKKRIDAEHDRTTKGFEAVVARMQQQEERIIGLEQLAADAMENIERIHQGLIALAEMPTPANVVDADTIKVQLDLYREQIEVEAARVGARVSRIAKLSRAMKDEPT